MSGAFEERHPKTFVALCVAGLVVTIAAGVGAMFAFVSTIRIVLTGS